MDEFYKEMCTAMNGVPPKNVMRAKTRSNMGLMKLWYNKKGFTQITLEKMEYSDQGLGRST